MPTRTPEEIRASIQQNRQELGESLERLRGEVTQLTDWRAQLRAHESQLMVVAVAGGFVAGGGIAGITGIIGKRRRKAEGSGSGVRARLRRKS